MARGHQRGTEKLRAARLALLARVVQPVVARKLPVMADGGLWAKLVGEAQKLGPRKEFLPYETVELQPLTEQSRRDPVLSQQADIVLEQVGSGPVAPHLGDG